MDIPVNKPLSKSRNFSGIILVLFLLLIASSCVSNKKAVYTQPQPGMDEILEFESLQLSNRIIHPDDELFIRVSSFDEEENFFTQLSGDFIRNETTNLVSYTVKEDGYVRLPYIGDIKVQNLTLDEASNKIQKALEEYLNQPTVFIKYVNKYVTVLGEVAVPGRYDYPDEFINIFQALGFAGDVTYFGNRNEVMVVREENNVIKRNFIDLTSEDLYESQYYYLRPNDIVYVQPLKRRRWGFQEFPFTLIISSLTLSILVLSIILR